MDCEVLQCFMKLSAAPGVRRKRKSAQWVRLLSHLGGLARNVPFF